MSCDDTIRLLYTTWPDESGPHAAAATLLSEKLIACANILGPSTSIYRWESEVQTEREIVALFKTSAASAARTCARLTELHPYDEPCIVALPVDRAGSAPGFLDWVGDETGERP